MNLRTYKAGHSTGRFHKGERITRLADIKPGDLQIKDSHQFKTTNLVKVTEIRDTPRGFDYQFAKTDGGIFVEPQMMMHEFELSRDEEMFYRAVK